MKDHYGADLAAGDLVLVPAKVLDVPDGDQAGRFETLEPAKLGTTPGYLWLTGRQVIKGGPPDRPTVTPPAEPATPGQ